MQILHGSKGQRTGETTQATFRRGAQGEARIFKISKFRQSTSRGPLQLTAYLPMTGEQRGVLRRTT